MCQHTIDRSVHVFIMKWSIYGLLIYISSAIFRLKRFYIFLDILCSNAGVVLLPCEKLILQVVAIFVRF